MTMGLAKGGRSRIDKFPARAHLSRDGDTPPTPARAGGSASVTGAPHAKGLRPLPGHARSMPLAGSIFTPIPVRQDMLLLLDLDRAQVALRLIVIERDGEVVQEGECLVFVGPEAIEQVADRTL